jgi:hypothetical protein
MVPQCLDPSIVWASFTMVDLPDADEAALPPADADPMTAIPLNASAARGPSIESTLENEVGLTSRVVKPSSVRKQLSCCRCLGLDESSILVAMFSFSVSRSFDKLLPWSVIQHGKPLTLARANTQ